MSDSRSPIPLQAFSFPLNRRDFLALTATGVLALSLPVRSLGGGRAGSAWQGQPSITARRRAKPKSRDWFVTQLKMTRGDLSMYRQGVNEKEVAPKWNSPQRDPFFDEVNSDLDTLAEYIVSWWDGTVKKKQAMDGLVSLVRLGTFASSLGEDMAYLQTRTVPKTEWFDSKVSDAAWDYSQKQVDQEMPSMAHERAAVERELSSKNRELQEQGKRAQERRDIDRQQYNIDANERFEATA